VSTRGTFGTRIDGVDRLAYNHFDSYPNAFGAALVREFMTALAEYGVMELADLARSVRCVNNTDIVTEEEYEQHVDWIAYKGEYDSSLDWYGFLREVQGKIISLLRAGIMASTHDFILDSLFCEWAYIFNFDDEVFEVYKGFQDAPHTNGRYADHCADRFTKERYTDGRPGGPPRYYPCALVITFPLTKIPADWVEQVEALTKEDEEVF